MIDIGEAPAQSSPEAPPNAPVDTPSEQSADAPHLIPLASRISNLLPPRVLAIANQKGGVGKTTTAINLGTALAAIGEQVLIIDLDPQGNASTGLGIDQRSREVSTYDVITGARPPPFCPAGIVPDGLGVAPG